MQLKDRIIVLLKENWEIPIILAILFFLMSQMKFAK